ncbi:MAG TPA: type II toxin-antitoxin system RelE/ParE family toxin [Bacteroidia bacterium]|jgi:mRNA interferase RelE/StbE|nr:type II toxin-antitoxin system RelE/ParE family toxin [Bacteroidia bacterium]
MAKLYTVVLKKPTQKQLDKLSDLLAASLIKAISALAVNPRPHGYKKLKGRSGYRIRVNDHRVIYEIHDRILTIEIINLGHRKDIYE